MIRAADLSDVPRIQDIEKDYYEGFSCPSETLESWVSTGRFLVNEEDGAIMGFMFTEPINEARAVPFVHEPLEEKGKLLYVSEVGTADDAHVLQALFEHVASEAKGRYEAVVWLTGSKSKHDKMERALLLNNGFHKAGNVKQWECYPGKRVDDHTLYLKLL